MFADILQIYDIKTIYFKLFVIVFYLSSICGFLDYQTNDNVKLIFFKERIIIENGISIHIPIIQFNNTSNPFRLIMASAIAV